MRNYDFILTGTGIARIEISGKNFHYKTGTEAAGKSGIVVAGERGGLQVPLLPGEGVGLPAQLGHFTLSKLDPTAGDITGTLLVGDGQFTASRVQGDVAVTNGTGLAAANAEAAHEWAGVAVNAATERLGIRQQAFTGFTAGNHWGCRLRNPAASGKLIVVKRVILDRQTAPTAGQSAFWLEVAPQAASLSGGDFATLSASDAAVTLAGIVSATSQAVAATAGNNGSQWAIFGMAVPRTHVAEPEGGFILRPGMAITAGVASLGTADHGACRYEWIERDL